MISVRLFLFFCLALAACLVFPALSYFPEVWMILLTLSLYATFTIAMTYHLNHYLEERRYADR